MAARRDPLSVRYDGYVRQVMIRAARASGSRRGVRVWIASPRGEFARPDPRGLTAHERAFTRSGYYLMWRVPVNLGMVPEWSLKVTWTDDIRPSSRGRMARAVNIRLFPRSQARVRGEKWTEDPSRQSKLGADGERVIPAR